MTTKSVSAAAGKTSQPMGTQTSGPIGAPRRWFARVFRDHSIRASAQFGHGTADEDPLLAFGVERTPAPRLSARNASPTKAARTPRIGRSLALAGGVVVLILTTVGAIGAMRGRWSPTTEPPVGKLTLDTRPAGVTVLVDGRALGTTPLSVALPPGAHLVTLRRGTEERQVPVTLSAGAQVTQYFEFARPDSLLARGGKISVVTDPPGARVHVDGKLRGTSPVTVDDLAASDHTVAVSSEAGSAKRTVTLEDGATTSVVFSLPKAAAPTAGWLALTAPFDVQIREDDTVVGSGRFAKIMLPTGNHAISIANDTLQYEDTRRIEVVAGRTTTLRIDAPNATISANARPWAEVIIDGRNIGQTPISNVAVAVGEREVIFRHPQLGERRQMMVVRMRGANRISVDMTKR